MREQTCCFTGHRDIARAEIGPAMRRTEECVRELIRRGVKFFGVGGALGYDTLTAKLLFRLREADLRQIRVILVYPFDGYTDRWPQPQRTEAELMRSQYDKVVRISERPGREAYLRRDRHLVDHSAFCICYCTRGEGGTAYTVRYAMEKGLEVFNTAGLNAVRFMTP